MTDHDPLFEAVVNGDEHCPDGVALAKLGRLLRREAAPPSSVDLVARVLAASRDETDAEGNLIDDLYDGQSEAAAEADPDLAKLGALLRREAQPPQEIDLLPDIARKLDDKKRSQRHSARLQVDSSTRWRIWTAVIGGHIAALIAILVTVDHWRSEAEAYGAERRGQAAAYIRFYRTDLDRMRADVERDIARRWTDLADRPTLLFGLRTDPSLRREALAHFGTDGCQGTVKAGLRWLRDHQDDDGSWGGSDLRGQATTAAALLALLADGAMDPEVEDQVRRGLHWLRDQQLDGLLAHDEQRGGRMAIGLVTLALVEGQALIPRADCRDQVQRLLADGLAADRSLHGDGFFALAVSTARLFGWVDPAAVEASLAGLDGSMADPGLQAVLARINGTDSPPVAELMQLMPSIDEQSRIDPLRWFLPGLALRDVGGKAWQTWAARLQRTVLLRFRYDGDGAWLPGSAMVNGIDSDELATSLALLNLQLAYRYLPMAPAEQQAETDPGQ